ncbi:MAG: hypothetical protein EXR72_05350 [Myxococcales bacterium]|nr:hypothetical protein [Myxococcales bacterium]
MTRCRFALLPSALLLACGCSADGLDTGGADLPVATDLTAAAPDLGAPDLALRDLARPLTAPNLCRKAPPPGATLAPPPPKYAGTCPKLGAGENTIVSSNAMRKFLLAVPKGLDPSEKLPVLFLWHWLGGSADSFYKKGEIQGAVDGQRFLAVLPSSKGDLFKWPFSVVDSDARMEEEFRFFDDLLACVAAQFTIEENCVASAGVSAGALFTDQLASARADRLSSAISLSGGTGGFAKPWGKPARKIPMVVLWGGPTDSCVGVVNFEAASKDLEVQLLAGGHFFVECVHNCGHSEPPIDAPPGLSRYASLWQFFLDHPFWLGGDSPYPKSGLPSVYPSWCEIGKGAATPRTGECTNKPGC